MLSPVLVVVALMVSMTTSCEVQGSAAPVQADRGEHAVLDLVPLEVPGGRWHTVIPSPVSVASSASWVFHSRSREPLDPPQSAVISNLVAVG